MVNDLPIFLSLSPRQHDPSMVGYSPGAVSYTRKEGLASEGHEPVVARAPWYRTRRGIIIIVAIIIVVIGAVVGGIVGGTHHSSKPKGDTAGQQQNSGNGSTTSTQQGQESNTVGSGAAPTSSTLAPFPLGPNSASPTASTTNPSASNT